MQNGLALHQLMNETGRPSHTIDYVVLTAIFVVFAYIFFIVAYTPILRFEALLMFILSYMLWGLLHHHKEATLTWQIVSEYSAFSFFLCTLLTVLIFIV